MWNWAKFTWTCNVNRKITSCISFCCVSKKKPTWIPRRLRQSDDRFLRDIYFKTGSHQRHTRNPQYFYKNKQRQTKITFKLTGQKTFCLSMLLLLWIFCLAFRWSFAFSLSLFLSLSIALRWSLLFVLRSNGLNSICLTEFAFGKCCWYLGPYTLVVLCR